MRKLALKLEELAVESFPADEVREEARGTVEGHYGANHTENTCGNERSCVTYCPTCYPTWCSTCVCDG